MNNNNELTLDDFKNALRSTIDLDVPLDDQTRHSSVLIVVYGGMQQSQQQRQQQQEPKILMTKKSSHLKIHAGEIAFPGGKFDKLCDSDLLYTALRESQEEIGLYIPKSKVIGQLDPVRTLNSNFTILPFVCVLDCIPTLECNCEVQELLHIPAHSFLQTLENDTRYNTQEMYAFTFEEHLIWGASARMLKQIVDRLLIKNLFKKKI